MPGQAGNGRRRSRRGEGVEDGEGGLQGGNQDGAIEVPGRGVCISDGCRWGACSLIRTQWQRFCNLQLVPKRLLGRRLFSLKDVQTWKARTR